MFEFLFNYPASVWQDATLVFDSDWSLALLGVLGLIVFLVLAVTLLRQSLSIGRRLSVMLIQGLAAAVVLTMLWQPALLVQGSEKGENTVAWLLDASSSMAISDVSNSPGGDETRFSAGVQLIAELGFQDDADFQASLYLLNGELESAGSVSEIPDAPTGTRTLLAPGLETLLGTVSESALAAVVLVSDGSDNSDSVDAQWWQSLAAAGVPVHTVGVGKINSPDDLQLSDVIVPLKSPPQAMMNARLKIAHGRGGLVRARVFAGDELLAAEDIVLPDDVRQSEHVIQVPTGEIGIRQLEFSIEAQDEAAVAGLSVDPDAKNNRQPRVVRIEDDPKRILYIEGEPRWEYKFLRRALDDQPGVQIVSLLRTSANKFYRQGVRDATELADGFPASRETLFGYDAVIIGSLEAAELSTAQQSYLRDFVSDRGGALLMLGGRNGLADGGWGRSVTAAALPVLLDPALSAISFERLRSRVRPTLAGYRTSWLQLADAESDNIVAWQELPELADVQSLGSVKPGAITLLERESIGTDSGGFEPLLVTQRYGRGKSLVLGTSGTWRWQMGLPSEDQRHERFWRQLSGMLVDDAVPRIVVETSDPVYRDTDTAMLSVTAYNSDFSTLEQAVLPVQITRPDGTAQTLELPADPQRPGVYSDEVATSMDGPYSVAAVTPLGGESAPGGVGSAEHWWIQESGNAESFDSQQQRSFLERVAEVTGGSYLAIEDSVQLTQLLAQKNAALVRELRLPLWNMPFFFLCLFAAKAIEWLLRLRWKRL